MRTRYIIYPVTITLMIIIPVFRYYATTPDINWCVLDYVDELENSNFSWYLYNINWMRHIEPKNSDMVQHLEKYKIWEAHWCLMASDNLFIDLTNTFYCTVTYIIRNAPISDNLKEPFGIYKWWDINR